MEQEKISPRKETYQFPQEAITNFAQSIIDISLKVKPGEKILIYYDVPGEILAEEVTKLCLQKKVKVDFFRRDVRKEIEIASRPSPDELENYFIKQKKKIEKADAVFIIKTQQDPQITGIIPPDKQKTCEERYVEAHQRRFEGKVKWCITYWPTEYSAQKERLGFNEFFKLFLEACDQPWKEIKTAQVKLVEMLNKGEKLEFIVNQNDKDKKKRTELKMSIKGMTFINSTVTHNYPGSEVFSAPVLDSVNGQLYAPGEHLYRGKLMENLYLKIKDGKIVKAYAEKGNQYLQGILNQGEGARYFGEVALGTNPGLKRRFFNPLLNEKVAGSFHMAIGFCDEEKVYEGVAVNVNNGNTKERASVHWDLSLLMHPQYGGGEVILDGEIIQKEGQFLDPELAILNPKI
ncbi:MAG: aminopeptidase [Candidatus Shapirobacteria bacterium]|nr:aminopeptidase [Candidatus Shapirobacteria bacterium]